MKKITLLILFILAPHQVFADAVADKALKAFSETSAKVFTQYLVTKQLDKLAAKAIDGTALAADAPGYVSQALAAYGLYKNSESFLEADLQSQKYYASVQVAGSIVGFAYPLIGGAISLIGTGQQALGDLAMKGRMESLIKERQSIIEMQEDIVRIVNRSSSSDVKYFVSLMEAHQTFLTKSVVYQSGIEKHCRDYSQNSEEKILECVEMSTRSFYALKYALQYLDQALNFRSIYFTLEEYFAFTNQPVSAESYRQSIHQLRKEIEEQEKGLQQMLQNLSQSLTEAHFERLALHHKPDLGLFCVNSILKELNELNRIDIKILEAKKNINLLTQLLSYRDSLAARSITAEPFCSDENLKESRSRVPVQNLKSSLEKVKAKDLDLYFKELFK